MALFTFHASHKKIYAILFAIVIIIGILVFTRKWTQSTPTDRDTTREHFVDAPHEKAPEYNSRLTVIDVFDAFLKRNPTPSEINKYSVYKNEHDILAALMKDYPTYFDKKEGDTKSQSDGDGSALILQEEQQPLVFQEVINKNMNSQNISKGEPMMNVKQADLLKVKEHLDIAYNTLIKLM